MYPSLNSLESRRLTGLGVPEGFTDFASQVFIQDGYRSVPFIEL